MKRPRVLGFEPLEQRQLLSTAHPTSHPRPSVVTTPLVLSGTLTVNNKATSTNMDEESDTTTSIPVSGQLVGIGEVRGTWSESDDEYGDYLAPDTLRLKNASGSFVVEFSEQNTEAVHHLAGGAEETVHPAIATDGTKAYAHTRGSGTIELTTNTARSRVLSLTLSG